MSFRNNSKFQHAQLLPSKLKFNIQQNRLTLHYANANIKNREPG